MQSQGDTQDNTCDNTRAKVHSIPIFVESRDGLIVNGEPSYKNHSHTNDIIHTPSEKFDIKKTSGSSNRKGKKLNQEESRNDEFTSDLIPSSSVKLTESCATYSSDPIPLPPTNWSSEEPPMYSSHRMQESSYDESSADNHQHLVNSYNETKTENGAKHKIQTNTNANISGAIDIIKSQVDELIGEIDGFKGSSSKDKQYCYLDEMLTRCMIDLDNIDCGENHNIRQDRKSVIKTINQAIVSLETKLECNITKLDGGQTQEYSEKRKTFRLSRFMNRFNPFRKHSD